MCFGVVLKWFGVFPRSGLGWFLKFVTNEVQKLIIQLFVQDFSFIKQCLNILT